MLSASGEKPVTFHGIYSLCRDIFTVSGVLYFEGGGGGASHLNIDCCKLGNQKVLTRGKDDLDDLLLFQCYLILDLPHSRENEKGR